MLKPKKPKKPSKIRAAIERKKEALALACFMAAVPRLISLWEERTERKITFDEWLLQVHNEHEKKGEKQ